MSDETSLSADMSDRNSFIISPPLLKTRSIDELDAVSVKNLLKGAV